MKAPRILAAVAALAIAMVFATAPAFATSPHFVSTSGSIDPSGQLIVSFKEAGLGDNLNISYEADASFSAVYACINGGGRHPQATNKETTTGTASGTGTFSSGRNGNITASITLQGSPPGPGAFTCPSGQSLVLSSITYTSVTLTDTTTPVGPVNVGSGIFTACFTPGIKGLCGN
jgi:hypothetical protein